jgi:hypothetical protein
VKQPRQQVFAPKQRAASPPPLPPLPALLVATHRRRDARQRGVVPHSDWPRPHGAVHRGAEVHPCLVHRHARVADQDVYCAALHRHSCAAQRHGCVSEPATQQAEDWCALVTPGTVTANVLPATAGSGTRVTDDGVMGPEPGVCTRTRVPCLSDSPTGGKRCLYSGGTHHTSSKTAPAPGPGPCTAPGPAAKRGTRRWRLASRRSMTSPATRRRLDDVMRDGVPQRREVHSIAVYHIDALTRLLLMCVRRVRRCES